MFGPPEEILNPWEEEIEDSNLCASQARYIYQFCKKQPKFRTANAENKFLDETTKQAALRVDRSVVALECFRGTEDIVRCCGTIIESHHNKTIVLTSANLIRRHPPPIECTGGKIVEMENVLAYRLEVYMHTYNGRSFVGEVCAYDFHFNLAILSFRTGTFYAPATLAHINDSKDVFATQPSLKPHSESSKLTPSQPLLKPHSKSSKLTPGDRVIVVGRYFDPPFILMAAPGYHQLERTEYDCKELFTTSCAITRCGDGAPMVNVRGEVIGVSHYSLDSTQCTPINIARKCWEYYKKFGKCSRPSLGMEATNLYATPDLGLLENIFLKFPHVSKGVIVEKVIPGSCADISGVCFNDVIIQCAGKTVESFLEELPPMHIKHGSHVIFCMGEHFFEIIMDHVGEIVEIVVIRSDSVSPIHLKLLVAEAAPDEISSWPNRIYQWNLVTSVR